MKSADRVIFLGVGPDLLIRRIQFPSESCGFGEAKGSK